MTLPPLPEPGEDLSQNLHWHALNYRGAILPSDAQLMWKELERCVELKIKAAVLEEREALIQKIEAKVKWVACDCGCEGGEKPDGARSCAFLQAAAAIRSRGE